MTMDKSAIEALHRNAEGVCRAVQENLPEGVVARPDNIVIEKISLQDAERHLPGRTRFRGQMLTACIADFVSFVKAEGVKGDGFIDADNHSAKVFFNLGTKSDPGHADHAATLKLKATAAFHALLNADGARSDQRGLIDWIEDWAGNLRAYGSNPAESKSLTEALAAIRQVTIKASKETESTEEDFRGARSTLEEVEAKSRIGLPGGFFFRCEPYLGLPARDFQLRLAVITSGDKPALSLRIVRREAAEEAITEDFKRVLIEEIGDAASMTIGTFTP